ncbi:MAG: sigma-70 family RNA polymerase sigma factor [Planctomycetaceae bacterium]|nr:sigma-70 family RNA polymerase sigma factor [Planctomycetaceae bacterium]
MISATLPAYPTTTLRHLPRRESAAAPAQPPTHDANGAPGEDIKYVFHPSFELDQTEEELFGPGGLHVPVSTWSPMEGTDGENQPTNSTALTSQEESLLFRRYNFARYRLCRLLSGEDRSGNGRARGIELWRQRAATMRAMLVRSNLALVYAMARRSYISCVESADLISEGSMALLRSIENFDISRGAKFSTYACRSILKAFGRMAKRDQRRQKRLPIQFNSDLDFHDAANARQDQQWRESVETLKEILTANGARLSKIERTIVDERFALSGGGKSRTLAEIARMVGLTDERVRQIQIVALEKIRSALERTYLGKPMAPTIEAYWRMAV